MSSHPSSASPPTDDRFGRTSLGVGDPLSADELLQIPVFGGASRSLLEKNRGAVVRRTFRDGDIICREGEFGSTAFYILEGAAQVFIATPFAHVRTQTRPKGIFSRLRSKLVGRTEDKREEELERRWIPVDASVDVSYDNPTAELHAGDLFGEMTCMNFYPRAATVRASGNVVVLEMLRNILDILLKNKTFKEQVDATYRKRALDAHLRSVPIFADLFQTRDLQQLLLAADLMRELRERVELVRYSPSQVICEQGDVADSLYLVRIGFVKVFQRHPGGDLVLAYLSRGNYFGEMGLLGSGFRTATCAALDNVELVRIRAQDFLNLVESFPAVRHSVETMVREREEQNRQQLETARSVPLENFLEQGLMQAQSLLVLDLNKCTRCDLCVQACGDAHEGVTRLIREGLRFENYLVATSCRQCRDPLCMVGCPVGAIRRRNSLEIIIEDWCIGCGLCARGCPYGNINMHTLEVEPPKAAAPPPVAAGEGGPAHVQKAAPVKKKATTCDLCADLDEPSCVYACPHDAAHRVDPRVFFAAAPGAGSEPGT